MGIAMRSTQLLLPLLALATLPGTQIARPRQSGTAAPAMSWGAAFVPNLGQWSHGATAAAWLGRTQATFAPGSFTLSTQGGGDLGVAVRLSLAGAETVRPILEQRLTGVHNYLLGNDRSRWRTQVPRYGRVRYSAPWPGVDVVCYALDGHLEYDVELAPGADLSRVVFAVAGADRLTLDGEGNLVMHTAIGRLRQSPPRTFAVDRRGQRRPVDSGCVLLGADRFGFAVPERRAEEALLLDPGLVWSTFVGGAANLDEVAGVHVDSAGITTAGGRCASDFPTTPGAFRTVYGIADLYVARFDPSRPPAQQLLYSTFLGGGNAETLGDLTVGPGGIVTVVGHTFSGDFPVTDGSLPRVPGADAFVTQLDPAGLGAGQLRYSTLIAGQQFETFNSVALDAAGRVVVCGRTDSTDFPVSANAFRSQINGNGGSGATDVVVCVVQPLFGRVYSTFLGGTGNDAGRRVAVQPGGVITCVGDAGSAAFPTTAGAYDTTLGGSQDAFVVRLDPSLLPAQQLLYGSYFGGTGIDGATGLAVDSAGVVTLGGTTASTNLPTTAGAFDSTLGGSADAFVARLDPSRPTAQQLVYATYLGGTSFETGSALVADSAGVIVMAGSTSGAGFPTTVGAFDVSSSGQNAFVTQIDPSRPTAQQVRYSTFLGGLQEVVMGLTLSPAGSVTVSGNTTFVGFPTTANAWQPTYAALQDGFITRLDLLPTGVALFGNASAGCAGPPLVGVNSQPRIGNAGFAFLATDAPANSGGVILLSSRKLTAPIPVLGVELWLDPAGPVFTPYGVASSGVGASEFGLPIPNQPVLVGGRVCAQYFWVGPTAPAPCPPLGLSATSGIEITVQP